jgi:hypothetical protein
MTSKSSALIKTIGDWFLLDHSTYIRIYGSMKYPHLLLWFMLDRLVLQEVSYQIVIHGVGGDIYQSNKAISPPFPLYISNYFFSNTKQAHEEVNTLLSYHFGEEIF